MILLYISDAAATLIAGAIFCVISGFIALGTLNADMKAHPWKFEKFLESDEAKQKDKEQSSH